MFFTGLFVDTFGSYALPFYVSGGLLALMAVIASIVMLVVKENKTECVNERDEYII